MRADRHTDRQTDRHKGALIAILSPSTGGKVTINSTSQITWRPNQTCFA